MENIEKNYSKILKLSEHLKKIEKLEDFKYVFIDYYTKEYVQELLTKLGDISSSYIISSEDKQNIKETIIKEIEAISIFMNYYNNIHEKAKMVDIDLKDINNIEL